MASLWCRTLGSKLVCMSWQIGMGAEFVFLVVPPKFVLFVKGFLSDTNWRIGDCALSKFDQKIVFELVLAPIQIRLFRAETKIKSILHSIKKRESSTFSTDREYLYVKLLNSLPLWSDLTKFRHFGNILKVLGDYVRAYLVLGKNWNFFGQHFMPLGKYSLLHMA